MNTFKQQVSSVRLKSNEKLECDAVPHDHITNAVPHLNCLFTNTMANYVQPERLPDHKTLSYGHADITQYKKGTTSKNDTSLRGQTPRKMNHSTQMKKENEQTSLTTFTTMSSQQSASKKEKDSIDLKEYFSIQMIQTATSRKFRTTTYTYTVKFKDFAPDVPAEEAEGFVTDLFDSLLEELKRQCQVKDRGRLSLSMYHDSLNSPVCLGFSTPAELTSSKLLRSIEDVQTMREEFDITDGKVTIHMAYVVPPWEEDNNHH